MSTQLDVNPEEELLARTAMRDREAFEELYKLTSPKLFGVALAILKRRDWAEDVLQEAFVKIWFNAAQYYQNKGSVMTWMQSIVRYRAIDMLRTHNKREGDFGAQWLVDSDVTNDESEKALDAGLEECLEQLQSNHKNSLMLAYCEGYTHQELSDRMKVPLGTLKSWIRRSIEKLRRCMDEL